MVPQMDVKAQSMLKISAFRQRCANHWQSGIWRMQIRHGSRGAPKSVDSHWIGDEKGSKGLQRASLRSVWGC